MYGKYYLMSRQITTALLTELASGAPELYYAVEIEFDSETLRIWSGIGNTTINGDTYSGAGNLLGMSEVEEFTDLTAPTLQIQLSGVGADIVSLALAEPYQNRPCKVYFGSTNVTDPILLFSGILDQMTINDTPSSATITLTVESRLVSLERTKVVRYTNASQKEISSTDTFFSYVEDLQDKEIIWGATDKK